MANVLEIIDAMREHLHISKEDLYRVKEAKVAKKGSFSKKLIRKT